MVRSRRWIAAILVASTFVADANGVRAQTPADAAPSSRDSVTDSPLIPQRILWPGVAVIIVLAIFVTAALVGPVIRANKQDEIDESDPPRDP